jgi:hypothetical protein
MIAVVAGVTIAVLLAGAVLMVFVRGKGGRSTVDEGGGSRG